MSKKLEFTQEQINNIAEMYKAGVKQRDIAKQYGIGQTSVRRLIQRSDVLIDESRSKPKKIIFSDIEIAEICDLYQGGLSAKDLANKYDVSRNTILRLLRKLDMQDALNKKRKEAIIFSKQDQEIILLMHQQEYSYKEIADACRTSITSIYNFLKSKGLTRSGNRIYNFNEHYFDKIDTPNKAYCLGLLYADGCNLETHGSIAISLQERDKHILDAIKAEMELDKPLSFTDYSTKNNAPKNAQNQYRLDINSRHMSTVLAGYGMVSHKSLVLQWPEFLNENLYSHFIRGYMDGDGSISKVGFRLSFVGTKDFCTRIAQILQEKFNITYSMMEASGHNGITFELYIRKIENTKPVLDWLYQDATLYLKRKYDIYISKYCSEENINNTSIDVAN